MSMREIKFRCFEKEKGMWGMDSNSAMNPAMFWGKVSNIKGEPNVMQFTGLKDKNGKECYEGDKIESIDPDGKGVIYTVSWNPEKAEFFPFDELTENGFVIIGNIWES